MRAGGVLGRIVHCGRHTPGFCTTSRCICNHSALAEYSGDRCGLYIHSALPNDQVRPSLMQNASRLHARPHALRRAWLPTHAHTLVHTTEAYAHVHRRTQARASTLSLPQGLVYDNQRRNVSYEDAQIQILPGVRATSPRLHGATRPRVIAAATCHRRGRVHG